MLQTDNLKAKSNLTSVVIVVIALNHLIGVVGLNMVPTSALFHQVAWLNLALSFVLVLAFHRPLNRNFALFCVIAFIVGMLAEIIGVNTGMPFGSYHYTPLFGWQLAGVPLIIGVNWVLLAYVCGVAVGQLLQPGWKAVLAASVLMVGIDLLLEPFAIRHSFWVWNNIWPGFENYLAWFVVALCIQVFFSKLIGKTTNRVALSYLVILLIFLIIDCLFYL